VYLKQADFQEFMEEYAKHFGLYDHIVFNSDVKLVDRAEDGKRWSLKILREGKEESRDFDKVVLCHGYQTVPNVPSLEGQDKFTGEVLHSQQFRE
jgi:dimethylaniline monooxygenase (N-oxide forming)